MRLQDLVETSRDVRRARGRLEKVERLAALFSRLSPDETEIAIAFMTRGPRQGRIGIGGALSSETHPAAADTPTLEIGDVDRAFAEIAGVAGARSAAAKKARLHDLLARATREEQDFLLRLLFGELRQGALEGLALEAVARAARVPSDQIRRAVMVTGALGVVARAAMSGDPSALDRLSVRIFQPLQPMLAQTAPDVDEALACLDEAVFEYKLDGARVQTHKDGDEVRVYSRNLREVTGAVPEIVEVVRALPARRLILDGEVIALREGGSPYPFQITMRRFGRKLDVDRSRAEVPLVPFFFDCLYVDDQSTIDLALRERLAALSSVVPAGTTVPRLVTGNADAAKAFARKALEIGHEGVMAKAPDAPYAAGNRGSAWMKIKQARTLDLVVLAAEWGHGRRQGWLSNLHLGARDPDRNAFVMLGKTFKGLTDQMLSWQTRALLDLELARDGHVVHVRPELVVEIAFSDLQASPQYPGGLALRFARVRRYRDDKTAADADTFEAVRDVYRRMTGEEPPAQRSVN